MSTEALARTSTNLQSTTHVLVRPTTLDSTATFVRSSFMPLVSVESSLLVLTRILYNGGVFVRCVFNQEDLLHVQRAVCRKHIPVSTLPSLLHLLLLTSAPPHALASVVVAACFVVSLAHLWI